VVFFLIFWNVDLGAKFSKLASAKRTRVVEFEAVAGTGIASNLSAPNNFK
jgi:hypothetical protein